MIIGISGKIGSGKSTLAKMLVEMLGPSWLRMSLGDEVKREAAEMFGFDLGLAYSPEGKNSVLVDIDTFIGGIQPSLTIREILQYWGTDVRRAEDPSYWVKKLAASIPPGKNVIIDDIRFRDEAEFVINQGGKLFRLDLYPGYQPPAAGSEHQSETDLDDYPGFHQTFAPRFGELDSVEKDIVDFVIDCHSDTLFAATIRALKIVCADPSRENIEYAIQVAKRAEMLFLPVGVAICNGVTEHHSV